MHKKLLIASFKKAKSASGEISDAGISRFLAKKIEELSGETYGNDALRGKYRESKKRSKENVSIRPYAADALSKYLGYFDFADFLSKNKTKKSGILAKVKTNKFAVIALIIFIGGSILYYSLTKQRWMVWLEDHYEEVDFNPKRYDTDQLKLYKVERIENFKKITPDCELTRFFDKNGNPTIWYGKNSSKEFEYFSALGKHPETGKTLKEITDYMIKKHVCN